MALPSPMLHRFSGSPWRVLGQEFDAWATAGRVARFWWRDDDAVAPSPALDRLLGLADATPLALAVIPEEMVSALADRLRGDASVSIIQHGIRHANHAAPEQKRIELGGTVPIETLTAGLTAGCARLAAAFGDQFLPVLAPPWNRIAPALLPRLPGSGFRALSGFGPRQAREIVPGLAQVNTHADPIDWKARRCRPAEDVAAGLAALLAAQRHGTADADEPVGLLTHHLLDDRETERLVMDLVSLVSSHTAARWVSLGEALAA